jgi:hypothetical protein
MHLQEHIHKPHNVVEYVLSTVTRFLLDNILQQFQSKQCNTSLLINVKGRLVCIKHQSFTTMILKLTDPLCTASIPAQANVHEKEPCDEQHVFSFLEENKTKTKNRKMTHPQLLSC